MSMTVLVGVRGLARDGVRLDTFKCVVGRNTK